MDHDAYQTPESAVLPMLEQFKPEAFSTGLRWGEPCRGDGNIYRHLPGGAQWAEINEGRDYLIMEFAADIIPTNPPFSVAEQFLCKSLQEAKTVIYLLRLNFLGSQKRKPFWEENRPTHLFTLSERPVFVFVCKTKGGIAKYPIGYGGPCTCCGGKVGPGTDATEYGWFAWDGLGILNPRPGMHWL